METKEIVPRLRFSNYVYETVSLETLYDFIPTNSFSRENLNYEKGSVKNIHYGDILTNFQTHFDVNKERVPYVNESIDLKKYSDYYFCKPGDIIFADSSEDYNGIGKHIEIISGTGSNTLAGLHTIHARLISDKVEVGFMAYLLQSWNMRFQIMRIAQGTKVFGISSKRLGKLFANIPPRNEQQKIASFLSSVDQKISQLEKKKTLLETYKRGIMQKIFSQELRFKDDDGEEFPEWDKKRLDELLDYEQPTKYIVKSTEYDDANSIPVLTAGKSFILGYTDEEQGIFDQLPVIIFDDFTMANKYVDFKFKVKSSAMKILKTSDQDTNIRFVYESMQRIKYPKGDEHKRFWISEYSKIKIKYPSSKEQQKITSFLSSIDKKIEITSTQLEKTREFKKGLLQQMFV